MKKLLLVPALGTAMAALSPWASAREIVVLPGVVSAVGVVSGVDTQGPGTLTIGAQNINTSNDAGGAITTTAADTASIVFSGNSTVTGFVGATGSTFLNIAAGSNASTVTFSGPVFATTFSVSGAGTVNFNGGFISNTGSTMDFAGDGFISVAAGQTVRAAITNSAGANTGTLTLNGNSIFDGAVGAASGLKAINVVGGNALITGQARAATYTLGTNTLNVAGSFATPVAGVINTTIFSPAVYGKIVPVGFATIGNALQVNVIVTGPITNGTSFNIVDAASGTDGSTVTATDNSARYRFAAAPTANGRVVITTTQIPLVDVVTPVVNPTAPGAVPSVNPVIPVVIAPVIDAMAATSTNSGVLTAISVLPTAAAVADALAQLGPGTTNFSAPQVSYLATQRFQDAWASHLEQAQSVCATDDQLLNRQKPDRDDTCHSNRREAQVWVSGIGSFGQQKSVGGFEGYDSDIRGVMVAYDRSLSDATRAGVGVRYARSKLDTDTTDGHSRINSYQATAYLAYAPGPWFANVALVAGLDDYEGSRRVVFTGVNSTMEADYSGHQYTAFGTTGYRFYVGDGQTTITPTASLQYTRLHTAGYTETGDPALNLRVAAQNYDFTQSGLGAKISRNMALSDQQTFRPHLHAKWLHSFGGDTMKNTASFTSGGPAFTVVGLRPDRDTYVVGGGLTLATNDTWSIDGGYDYQWRANGFSAHQFLVKFVLHM